MEITVVPTGKIVSFKSVNYAFSGSGGLWADVGSFVCHTMEFILFFINEVDDKAP